MYKLITFNKIIQYNKHWHQYQLDRFIKSHYKNKFYKLVAIYY
jgi:hypothetical protein